MRRPVVNLVAVTLLALASGGVQPTSAHAASNAVESNGTISGVVSDDEGNRVEGALVILQCACLQDTRETKTNANGLYAFRDLPPGKYEVVVLHGQGTKTRVFELSRGEKMRSNFVIDPDEEFKRVVTVKTKPVRQNASRGVTISMDELRSVPVGNSRSRDSASVVVSGATAPANSAGIRIASEPANREGYAHTDVNDFLTTADRPLSTFSADVDTASYSNVRRFVEVGQRPPPGAVRIEELVNYFDYGYQTPTGSKPVSVNWEIAQCPWNDEHLLARIGLQTRPIDDAETPPRNLVFLLDVSGSMSSPDKLPLLKRAMQLLVDNLREQDSVSIVVYAGAAGMALPPTRGDKLTKIRDAISQLESGGSTNGAGGIRLAYDLAKRHFLERGINRVILATDGDFNVGTTSHDELVDLIEDKRKSGVFLSVLGFGTGNLQDQTMELLADKGNGNYAYIDSLHEARKVLVDEAGATLVTVAKDVKLQVEFNPSKVAEYRLIGYENRLLADEDFEDDTKDAGDMGAGHSVTALYELVPAGKDAPKSRVRKLRYQSGRSKTAQASSEEWMTVAVRFKRPDADKSRLIEVPMRGTPNPVDKASDDLRFAAAVAAYGMQLRDSPHKGDTGFGMIKRLAKGSVGRDAKGYRKEFIRMVNATRSLPRRRR